MRAREYGIAWYKNSAQRVCSALSSDHLSQLNHLLRDMSLIGK